MDYKTGEKSNTISCQFVTILHFVAKLYNLIGMLYIMHYVCIFSYEFV